MKTINKLKSLAVPPSPLLGRGRRRLLLLLTVNCLLLTAFSSCVKSELHDTPYPDQGQVELTTDWADRGTGIAIPASYTVAIDGKTLTMNGVVNNLPILTPGTYPCLVYNTAEKITVSGNTATLASSNGTVEANPDWFFTSPTSIKATADKKEYYTATMMQQIRQLNLELTVKEGDANRIKSITASLDGIASELNMTNNEHSAAATVVPVFTRANDKLSATVRLLGTTGASQKLTLKLTFTDNNTQVIESDLATKLSNFNTNKNEPLKLSADINTAVEVGGITATITDWILGGNKPGTAN